MLKKEYFHFIQHTETLLAQSSLLASGEVFVILTSAASPSALILHALITSLFCGRPHQRCTVSASGHSLLSPRKRNNVPAFCCLPSMPPSPSSRPLLRIACCGSLGGRLRVACGSPGPHTGGRGRRRCTPLTRRHCKNVLTKFAGSNLIF